jgi:hypothetical protein
MMKGLGAAVAASLALVATAGNAAQPVAQGKPCLQPAEANALLLAMTPDALQATVALCSKTLPANAYLSARGTALVARYRGPAEAAKPDAARAFAKMVPEAGAMGEGMFGTIAGPMIGQLIAEEVKPESCGRINQMLELLDPLPPENLSRLIVAILEMTAEGPKAKAAPFEFCKTAS